MSTGAQALLAFLGFAIFLPIFMRLFMWWVGFVDYKMHDLRQRWRFRDRGGKR